MGAVRVGDVERAVADAFPTEWAEPWDRVGLLAGDPARAVTSVLVTLDATKAAIARARECDANVLATHHPAFLEPPSTLRPGRGASGVLFAALDTGVALINAHTNLDRSPTVGTLLPSMLGLAAERPLERSLQPMTLVTVFVPEAARERVSGSMAEAGAGRIGEYDRCAFAVPGTGSFVPRAGTHPSVGTEGMSSAADEQRLEMVCATSATRGVVEAARAAHPYEEPLIVATDVAIARGAARMGTVCEAPPGATVRALAETASAAFGITPRVWGPPDTPVRRVVTATGSAGALVGDALAAGAHLLVAGEVRYHDALDAVEAGLAIIEVGHDMSEWPLVAVLADAVRATPGLDPDLVHVETASAVWWTP